MTPMNVTPYLAQKYSILQDEANARMLGAQAQMFGAQSMAPMYAANANLTNTQASVLPQTAQASIGLDKARAGNLEASTGYLYPAANPAMNALNEQMFTNPMQRPSANSMTDQQLQGASFGGMPSNIHTVMDGIYGPPTGRVTTPGISSSVLDNTQNHATGTANVKGPGGPTDDRVKANLSNGEAVLNAGAAEHLGRENIKALNAVGLMRMGAGLGMVPAKGKADSQPTQDDRVKVQQDAQTAGKTGAYAGGTSNVGPFGRIADALNGSPAPAPMPVAAAAPQGAGMVSLPQMHYAPPVQAAPQSSGNTGLQIMDKTGGYAKGTSNAHKGGAAPKAKAKAPAKDAAPAGAPSDTPSDLSQINPQALAAALQMGQMGANAPAQPMPGPGMMPGGMGGMPPGGMM